MKRTFPAGLFHGLAAMLILTFECHIASAQSEDARSLAVHKTSTMMKIDGLLTDEEWATATQAEGFINKWPTDSGTAVHQTVVSIKYDEQFLYLGIKSFYEGNDLVIQSLARDVNPYYSDGVSVVLDPTGRSLSGYTFGVNAAGAEFDGIVNVNSDSFEWDAKWFSATHIFPDYWTAEMAIPFSSLRFPPGSTSWGINFIRNDMTSNCFSTWNRVPLAFFGANLNYLGLLNFMDGLPKSRHNYALFPYFSARRLKDGDGATTALKAGGDVKVALGESMNLDLTLNPDFSQTEVDKQIINLNRYDILLPEHRTFFLENSNLFSNMGLDNESKPFVSRRIGLTNDGRTIPIAGGARLTGNLNPDLRIGLMNLQTQETKEFPSQNYSVASFDQRIFGRSDISGIFTNRQTPIEQAGDVTQARYNRVAGMELNFLSRNSKFNERVGTYSAFQPGTQSDKGFDFANVSYTGTHLNGAAGWAKVNTNYVSDMGFTPRLYNYDAARDTLIRIGYTVVDGKAGYTIYPRIKSVINDVVFSNNIHDYQTVGGLSLERSGQSSVIFQFANRREMEAGWSGNRIHLPFPTALFPETGLLAPGTYDYGVYHIRLASNFLRPFSWDLTLEDGGYFNGKRTTLAGSVKVRRQPWGNFSADFTYNQVTLNAVEIHPYVAGTSMEIFFSKQLSWSTYLQYNSGIENVNISSRLQWRFRPLSDLFLIYSDNYTTGDLLNKNRGVVIKATIRVN